MADIAKSLHFDPMVFLIQIGVFLLLWNILARFFWQPILAHLEGRDKAIENAYQTVENTRHEMEQLRADYQTRIAQIEAEARTHIQTAIKEAQTERERILAEARAQSDAAIRQGIADMEQEKSDALTSLRERIFGLALATVGKALGAVTDDAALRRALEESVAQHAARN